MTKKTSNLKRFLMSLAATTVSIVLTFGTTVIIDRKKQKAEKREMVMMIMYDMHESLEQMEQCDEDLKSFFDLQVDLIAHPDRFQEEWAVLAVHIPVQDYFTMTTENIFRSNVETIRTIGNVLFVQTVSSFYDRRARYKTVVIDEFKNQAVSAIGDYERLLEFDSTGYPFYSQSFISAMQREFEACKLMMKVSDRELEEFAVAQKDLSEKTDLIAPERRVLGLKERQDRLDLLQQAREEGRKALSDK